MEAEKQIPHRLRADLHERNRRRRRRESASVRRKLDVLVKRQRSICNFWLRSEVISELYNLRSITGLICLSGLTVCWGSLIVWWIQVVNPWFCWTSGLCRAKDKQLLIKFTVSGHEQLLVYTKKKHSSIHDMLRFLSALRLRREKKRKTNTSTFYSLPVFRARIPTRRREDQNSVANTEEHRGTTSST